MGLLHFASDCAGCELWSAPRQPRTVRRQSSARSERRHRRYKDDLFLEDDVVFKKAVAEYVDLDIDTVVDACDKGAVKTVTNSNGHKLIVWEYDTEDKLFEFDEEQNGGW